MKSNPTKETYDALSRAHQFFNRSLFQKSLPPCVITALDSRRSPACFRLKNWEHSAKETVTDEISFNPIFFKSQSIEQILSNLVHEMCHQQQHHFGRSGKHGYHNKQFKGMMEAVGLLTYDISSELGKGTGYTVSHRIEKGGRFELSCKKLLDQGFTIPWHARIFPRSKNQIVKAASKTKFSCPTCDLNAWAKPAAQLKCGHCESYLISASE